jgi:hypothetical protein
MAMIEVAYQIHDVANILVASERSEPGDGWSYSRAFRRLPAHPETTPRTLVRDMVGAYRGAYGNDMTLSAIDLAKIPPLALRIFAWTKAADPANFHHVRRNALDCSPRPGDACDLGSFLDAASHSRGSATHARAEAWRPSCHMRRTRARSMPGNFRTAGGRTTPHLGPQL